MIDFDTDWAKLEWDKPEFDGGSTISGYIIEKRDKQFQKWEVCARSEGETPICKVTGLIEGSIYEFRVRAVNKAGESEPSDPSFPHRSDLIYYLKIVFLFHGVIIIIFLTFFTF